MTLSMACSFAGYEFLRTAATTAFTEIFAGSTSINAVALATAAVSPFSVLVLACYSRVLDASGPRAALRTTLAGTITTILIMLLSVCILGNSSTIGVVNRNSTVSAWLLAAITAFTFLWQNSYLNLLCSQQWSFVNSVMDDHGNNDTAITPTVVATTMGRIAGVSCAVSTMASASVPWLVLRGGGIKTLWLGAAVWNGLAWWAADRVAYPVAAQQGWDPRRRRTSSSSSKASGQETADTSSPRTWRDAVELLQRVPILSLLAIETVAFSALNTVLNVRTVNAVAQAIPDAVQRSSLWGKFYAATNGAAAVFQFGIVPLLPSMALAWRWVALVPLVAVVGEALLVGGPMGLSGGVLAAASSSSSLVCLMVALWATKVMDYSVRSVAGNMVYQPLDFESRFFGKGKKKPDYMCDFWLNHIYQSIYPR